MRCYSRLLLATWSYWFWMLLWQKKNTSINCTFLYEINIQCYIKDMVYNGNNMQASYVSKKLTGTMRYWLPANSILYKSSLVNTGERRFGERRKLELVFCDTMEPIFVSYVFIHLPCRVSMMSVKITHI